MSTWLKDAVGGTRDHLGVHNSGNVVVVRSKGAEVELDWTLIDGQQRMTTTSLLVAAIRDAALKEGGTKKLIEGLERILYVGEAGEWSKGERTIQEGEDLDFCRLLPSFHDRRSFFVAVTEGICQHRTVQDMEQLERSSLQMKAKRIFDSMIRNRLDSTCGSNASRRVSELEELSRQALYKMGLTLAEIQGPGVNLAQVFLWLQEKTLFGEGALLHNPTPGVDFAASDLQRNLVLASVAGRSLAEQEQFYRDRWLGPLENR